ncbi:MAG: SdiA-regulated domain-containing protein [Bdellovibrionota bacterium]
MMNPKHATRLLGSFLVVFGIHSLQAQDIPTTELNSARFIELSKEVELSGGRVVGGRIFAVSDDKKDDVVFEVKRNGKTKKYIDLKRIQGFSTYMSEGSRSKRLDLEGLEFCGSTMYLADERSRQVLVVNHGRMSWITWEDKDLKPWGKSLGEIGKNDGFEGIAVDCDHQILYVAKERDPRFIIEFDLEKKTIKDVFDLPVSLRHGKKGLDPSGSGKEIQINADFADLTFRDGYLYVLERNAAEISKVDPKTKKVVHRYIFPNYFRLFDVLSDAGVIEPFGLAEGLDVRGDTFWLFIDNNGGKLNAKGKALGIHQHSKKTPTGKEALIMMLKADPKI